MQRYFVARNQLRGRSVVITGEDARHIERVVRLKEGDRVTVSDGAGRDVLAQITSFGNNSVLLETIEELKENNEPRVQVWIAQSLPKGDKMETVIQKCTEIGAVRFIPFLSARTIVQYDARKEQKRLERWNKIAKEAAEQAQRSIIPQIDLPRTWEQLLTVAREAGAAFLCYEKETSLNLKKALQSLDKSHFAGGDRPILLAVGPEGGLELAEVEQFRESGGREISLGKRILRTETAAASALSCILYEFDEI